MFPVNFWHKFWYEIQKTWIVSNDVFEISNKSDESVLSEPESQFRSD